MSYPDRLLRRQEALEVTGLSNGKFHDEQRAGRIKVLRIGRATRYRWTDLVAYMDSLAVQDRGEPPVRPTDR